jgi:hypothetical protein
LSIEKYRNEGLEVISSISGYRFDEKTQVFSHFYVFWDFMDGWNIKN